MSIPEHIVIRISDLDPDEREDIEHIIQQALDADAYLHIEVRKVGRACGVCGGALEPSTFGGYVHADDADDTHTPVEASPR